MTANLATPVYRREELPDVARNLSIEFFSLLGNDIVRARRAVAQVINVLTPSQAAYVATGTYTHLLRHHGFDAASKFMEALAIAR